MIRRSPQLKSWSIFACTLVLSLAGASAAFAMAAIPSPCSHALHLDAGARTAAAADGEIVAVSLSEPGWLLVELATEVPGGAWFAPLAAPCASDSLVAERAAGFFGRGVVAVPEAGTLFLRVGAVDAASARGEDVQVFTRFVPEGPRAIIGHDGEPGDDTDDGDEEIVPLVDPGPQDPGTCLDSKPLVVRLSEELLGGSDPVGTGGARSPACSAGEPADDFAACAAVLDAAGTAAGRIDAVPGGFDRDYLAFHLDSVESLEIAASGPAGLRLTVLDGAGRLLASRDLGKGGEDLRFVLSLVPGSYLLRLEGTEPGAYAVRVSPGRP